MYAWIALAAIAGTITIGAMTMYVVVFRQAQASLASVLGDLGGLYEDNLYLSTLYELLDLPTARRTGGVTTGAAPGDGVRFTDVAFTYPGATEPALTGISPPRPAGLQAGDRRREWLGQDHAHQAPGRALHPDRRGGSPSTARRSATGTSPPCAGASASSSRTSSATSSRSARTSAPGTTAPSRTASAGPAAAEQGLAAPVVATLPAGFDTRLGKWFKDGRELSLGQWQKIALARAFMRARR
jgi:ATP-binding cassette subfamily B protein